MLKIRRMVLSESTAPFVSKDHLRINQRAADDDELSQPPLDFLHDELSAYLDTWLEQTDRLKLIVLPPCEQSNLLEKWASSHGYESISAPPRDLSVDTDGLEPLLSTLSDSQTVVVLPQLEHWFLRCQGGLERVSRLLEQLDASNHKCVVGCNSWAWRYLSAVVPSTSVLPPGVTFQAVDGASLRAWFARIEPSQDIRLAANGARVLSDAEDERQRVDNYFDELAAHSLGIPWVAWHAWRRSFRLRTGTEGDAGDDDNTPAPDANKADDAPTIWLAEVSKLRLPNPISIRHLFVLQALLIHGELTDEELKLVCPDEDHTGAAIALRRAGVIERVDGRLRCCAVAYPMVRAALSDAGFPLDSL